MTNLHDRLAEIRDDFRPDWDEEKTQQVLEGVPARRRYRRNRKLAAVATVCLALVASGLLLSRGAQDGGVTAPNDGSDMVVEVPDDDPNVLVLADGSRVTKKDGERVELVEGASETRMTMGDGRSSFEITAGADRTYFLTVGKVEIETARARFDVESDASSVKVLVLDGTIEVVTATGAERTLTSGAREEFATEGEVAATPEEASRDDIAEPGDAQPAEVREPKPEPVAAEPIEAPAPPKWSVLAERGDWKEAAAQLGSTEDIEEIEMLLLAADVKRYNDQPQAAIILLDRVAREFPDDKRATIAQFQKGRIEMQLGKYAQAARSWQKVSEMSPSSSLAEDSLSREVEAWFRAGDKVTAKERARTYLERFPNGYRTEMVRRYGGVAKP